MGSITGRDSNITIYMNLNKQFYVAGEYVEGQIYLDVKTDRNYSNLCIKLQGEEYVFWSQHHGKYDNRIYTNTYKNYAGHFLVADFHGVVKTGQYVFPFSFLLPSMMTGSFYSSRLCYLKYILKAVLVHQTSERENQVYEMFLNILQPPRMPIGSTTFSNNVNSKCCGCCKDYGNIAVSLTCDKNFVRNGDPIRVTGTIDNSNGKIRVNEAKVIFQQNMIKIASNQYNTQFYTEKEYTLHTVRAPTAIGQRQQFSFYGNIPNDIIDCTAIGRIVARYFVLHLDTSYGCCANTSQAYLHLIVHSKTPVVVEKKTINMPAGWYPKQFPKVTCEYMNPYAYAPLPLIPFLNLPGNSQVQTNLNFQNQMQEMQRNVGYELGKQITFQPQDYTNYQPQYYGQDMFSQQQRIQQGYQPYFSARSQNDMLLQEKK